MANIDCVERHSCQRVHLQHTCRAHKMKPDHYFVLHHLFSWLGVIAGVYPLACSQHSSNKVQLYFLQVVDAVVRVRPDCSRHMTQILTCIQLYSSCAACQRAGTAVACNTTLVFTLIQFLHHCELLVASLPACRHLKYSSCHQQEGWVALRSLR